MRGIDEMTPMIAAMPNGCWLWTGQRTGSGYPRVKKMYARDRAAHRVIYEDMGGTIPFGMQLDHLCGIKLCVNPGHMEVVEMRENIRRRDARRRR